MGSDAGVVGVRVSDNDGENRKLDAVSGTSTAYGSLSSKKEQDTEIGRSSYFVSSSMTEDSLRWKNHGVTNGSTTTLITVPEGKQAHRKVGKIPRNGSESFKKVGMLQVDTVLPPAENIDSKMELDTLGSQLVKCSNAADKSQTVKQRSTINGKRGDRKSYKVPVKAKFDSFSLKAGSSSFSPASGGIYGLKSDVKDVSKLMEDISLEELLDGTFKCPTFSKDKENRTVNVNAGVLDSVRKVYSLICLKGAQQDKQTEEVDVLATKCTNKPTSSSSPSNNNLENGSDGDGRTDAVFSKCDKELESCVSGETSTDISDNPLYEPRDVLEKLGLPPAKDLESLLQDSVKPNSSMKLTDSSSSKQSSRRVSLPPFPWSHNFNGHHKANYDKSTCSGRWVRISNTANFVGRRAEGAVDLDSLTYDSSLVPAGQVKYRLPEIGTTSTTCNSQPFGQHDVLPVASPPVSLAHPALHSPRVIAAARTLCDMASTSKRNSNTVLKWPKLPSQKAAKARKFRLNDIPEEDFSTPTSDTSLSQVPRNMELGSSSKKSKFSRSDRKGEYSHVQAVIGLSSVSGPRSNRVSRDSISEAKHFSGSFAKPSYMPPPPPPSRVLDRSSNQNPKKSRKFAPMDLYKMSRREPS